MVVAEAPPRRLRGGGLPRRRPLPGLLPLGQRHLALAQQGMQGQGGWTLLRRRGRLQQGGAHKAERPLLRGFSAGDGPGRPRLQGNCTST